jgi:hypothetical protein
MNSHEFDTPLGKERLKNCVFKLLVRGKMVTMLFSVAN